MAVWVHAFLMHYCKCMLLKISKKFFDELPFWYNKFAVLIRSVLALIIVFKSEIVEANFFKTNLYGCNDE